MSKKKLNEQDYSSDVCLISEDMEGMNKFYKNKNFEKNFCQTAQFTIDFCIKHKKKMLFAVKRDKKYLPVVETGIVDFFKKEMEYYKNYLSPEAFQYMKENLMDRSEGEYSSYRAMYFSKITVGTVTTMLKEKLTLGGKILACNQSKMNWLNFPIEGICSLNNCRFDEFEKRMFEIFKISHDEYFSKISRKKTYLMNYNPKYSSLDMIKDKIQSFGYRQIRQA